MNACGKNKECIDNKHGCKRKFKSGKNLEHCKDKDHVHDIGNECKDEDVWW
jgi:hypothetical protein